MTTQYGSGVRIIRTKAQLHSSHLRTWRYYLATTLHGMALFLFVASMGLNQWITGFSQGQRVNLGLWQACLDGECVSMLKNESDIVDILGGVMIWIQVLTIAIASIIALSFIFAIIVLILNTIPIKNIEGLATVLFVTGLLIVLTATIFHYSVFRPLNAHSGGSMVPSFLWSTLLCGLITVGAAGGYEAEYRHYTHPQRTEEYIPLTEGK